PILLEPLAKHDLVHGGITLVGKHRRQTFLVVGHQVYTQLRRDFSPLLFADPLQILKVAFLMGGNEVQAQYSTLHGPIHSPLDHRYRTRGYLAWSPRPTVERWTVVWCCFHLRIIAPIVVCFSSSCLPMVL